MLFSNIDNFRESVSYNKYNVTNYNLVTKPPYGHVQLHKACFENKKEPSHFAGMDGMQFLFWSYSNEKLKQ